jgi:glycine/D-amino acid oxidase-like deaminating enzyme
LDRASTIIPGLSYYLDHPDVLAHDGGFYARTPDGLPVIGQLGGPDGIHVVGGLAGFGTMMACAAGELAAMWALEAAIPDFATVFAPRRFLATDGSARRSPGEAPAGEL